MAARDLRVYEGSKLTPCPGGIGLAQLFTYTIFGRSMLPCMMEIIVLLQPRQIQLMTVIHHTAYYKLEVKEAHNKDKGAFEKQHVKEEEGY